MLDPQSTSRHLMENESLLRSALVAHYGFKNEQAGTELGQAQLKLDLGFTSIGIWCITLMITN